MEQKDVALVTAKDLSLVYENAMNEKQLKLLLSKTPKQYVRQRPAKGGGTWDYVSGGYIKKILNLMFGWDWDFEIIKGEVIHGEAIVLGRLTIRTNGKVIRKEQYGNKDIIFKTEKVTDTNGSPVMIEKNGKVFQQTRPSNEPLSIGNDMKAAATDSLKKCAAELGIAADIYNKNDFREISVNIEPRPDVNIDDIKVLLNNAKSLEELKQIEKDNPFISINAELFGILARLKKELK